jgi:hypothetical protein
MSENKMVSRNVAIALGLICIILSVGLVTVTLTSYSHNSESNNSDVFNEPPPLNIVVNSTEDKVNDLESLGCKIVYSTHWYLTFYAHVNYTEFRRMAYNSKIVLCFITYMDGYYFDSHLYANTKIFCTMFNGVAIFTL